MAARAARWLGWTLLVALCAATFIAYLQPEFAFTVANKIWSCF
jgi:hypothetical protein